MKVTVVSDVGELGEFLNSGGELPPDDEYSEIFHGLKNALGSNYVFASSPPYDGAGIIGDEYTFSRRQINLVVESGAQDEHLAGRIHEFLESKAQGYSVLLDIADAESPGGQVWIVVRIHDDVLAWPSHQTGKEILEWMGLIEDSGGASVASC